MADSFLKPISLSLSFFLSFFFNFFFGSSLPHPVPLSLFLPVFSSLDFRGEREREREIDGVGVRKWVLLIICASTI